MNKIFNLKTSFIIAAMLTLPLAHAAMTKAEYEAGKTRISADEKAGKKACDVLSGNAKDICVEEAKGKEKVAAAELEYGYTNKPDDWNKVMIAQAESAYAIAKEKCDDKAGNVKDVCVAEAKAAETRALANVRLSREVDKANVAATEDKNEADYKVAAKKCDALSGAAKSSCIAAAKAKFGKS